MKKLNFMLKKLAEFGLIFMKSHSERIALPFTNFQKPKGIALSFSQNPLKFIKNHQKSSKFIKNTQFMLKNHYKFL